MPAIREGRLRPLPYSVFDGDNVADAFQLMQQSGHVGKIVVRPPENGLGARGQEAVPCQRQGHAYHHRRVRRLRLETAKWLVERGARHLVMIGRRGAASAEAQGRCSTNFADPRRQGAR